MKVKTNIVVVKKDFVNNLPYGTLVKSPHGNGDIAIVAWGPYKEHQLISLNNPIHTWDNYPDELEVLPTGSEIILIQD